MDLFTGWSLLLTASSTMPLSCRECFIPENEACRGVEEDELQLQRLDYGRACVSKQEK